MYRELLRTAAVITAMGEKGGLAQLAVSAHFDYMSKPGTAAVLSFFVPGVGQIYNGEFWRGIFWLVVTPGFWVGTGGMLGWVCHLVAAWTAYRRAEKKL